MQKKEKSIEIAKRLRHLRAHITQKEFAKKIGITDRAYQNYEGGRQIPKWDILHRIADICNVPVNWILTGVVRVESTNEELLEDIRKSAWREGKKLTKEDEQRELESKRKVEKEILEIKPDFDDLTDFFSYHKLTQKVKRICKEGNETKLKILKDLLKTLDPGINEALKEEESDEKLKEGAA